MANRNAPGCWQVIVAFALVIFGACGGCFVGVITNVNSLWINGAGRRSPDFDHASALLDLWIVGGLLIGAILAARGLLRRDE